MRTNERENFVENSYFIKYARKSKGSRFKISSVPCTKMQLNIIIQHPNE